MMRVGSVCVEAVDKMFYTVIALLQGEARQYTNTRTTGARIWASIHINVVKGTSAGSFSESSSLALDSPLS